MVEMVPHYVGNINEHIFSSLVKLSSNSIENKIQLSSIADRASLKKDNLFKNYIQI
jgi:hypothetical protein